MEDKFINPVRNKLPEATADSFTNQISNGVKLTSAVYRLSDFFPEGEPLKNRAKDRALAITENLVLVFGTQGWASLQKDKAKSQLLGDIEIILNYLKLAKSFGWIDTVNFLIISKEYERIKSQISLPIEKLPAEPVKKAENTSTVEQTQKVIFQKTIENQMSFTDKNISQPKSSGFSISDRQKKILQVLNEKGKAQVSDFKTFLGDITKRTIRRDLDELLKNRRIIRVGEWNQVSYQIGQG
ncbi:MAG: DeoR family transcriptional regulator [Candidatus Staskawiczbacteria bacterium]|nr:DeoR family transcriptional regulator [Candidatus Staskawiczbacteria bacterium]MBI3337271.1 DeoR family transcriptional regulator [Candidatus Staskawiczbacteria bacterium]